MPSFDSKYCLTCPYRNQKHLPPEWQQKRDNVPLEVEDNESDILLVIQAPGEAEWKAGKPLQPTTKQGGTAGIRVEQSWGRKGKQRADFNITNAVQCFPGKADGRDLPPDLQAVQACSGWLRDALNDGQYRQVIALGDVASLAVGFVVALEGLSCEVKHVTHPNGGLKSADLDALWE
ncbi:uracil-DNA glycosylase family protein [Archangium sp.]|uniref:uracil-DNA glycosylase family protein n=1 Tax=Archangium sp. TaxID=1872627 RepID=UPI00286D56BC|nr:uracil-DNA glycosylase family protein [Archangium sp.]